MNNVDNLSATGYNFVNYHWHGIATKNSTDSWRYEHPKAAVGATRLESQVNDAQKTQELSGNVL